jgi:hypothetical protein
VFLILQTRGGQPISVYLPQHKDELQEGEFFFKDWGDQQKYAERLVAEGIVVPAGRRVQSEHAEVLVATINESKLTDFTKQEMDIYTP